MAIDDEKMFLRLEIENGGFKLGYAGEVLSIDGMVFLDEEGKTINLEERTKEAITALKEGEKIFVAYQEGTKAIYGPIEERRMHYVKEPFVR